MDIFSIPATLLPRVQLRLNPRRRVQKQKSALAGHQDAASAKPPTKPAADANIGRATELAYAGFVHRAAQVLASTIAPLSPTTEVIEQLSILHPQGPEVPRAPQGLSPIVTSELLSIALRTKLARGSAPGLDGWTRELILPLMKDKICREGIGLLIQSLVDGRYNRAALRDAITAAKLLPFSKPNGGVRPIAIESAWLRLASHVSMLLIGDETLAKVISPTQCGVGIGPERAVHTIRSWVQEDAADAPEHLGIVFLDFVNAFNTVNRATMLQRLYSLAELQPLHHLVDLCYGAPSCLHLFDRGVRAATITSTQGVRQGSVVGPFLFALAIDEELKTLADTFSHTVAYLDDITVAAHPRDVGRVLDVVTARFGPLNLKLNLSKGKTTILSREPILNAPAAVAHEMFRALGSPVGFAEHAMMDFCVAEVGKCEPFFQRLPCLHPVLALRILALSAVPRLNYLARTTPPNIIMPAAQLFDARILACVSTIIGVPLSGDSAAIAQLPSALGGLGVRSMTVVSPLAYEASISGIPKQQHDLVAAAESASALALAETSKHIGAILKSAASGGANVWWLHIGSRSVILQEVKKVLPSASAARRHFQFRTATSSLRPTNICLCGSEVGQSGHVHALHCQKFGKTNVHDHLMKAFVTVLRAHNVVYSDALTEFRGPSHERPDMTFNTSQGESAIDFSIVHPLAREPLRRRDTLRASSIVEERKNRESRALCASKRMRFWPFVVETTGAIGSTSRQLMRYLAKEFCSSTQEQQDMIAELYAAAQVAVIEGHGNLYAQLALQCYDPEQDDRSTGQDPSEGEMGGNEPNEVSDGRVKKRQEGNMEVEGVAVTGDKAEEQRRAKPAVPNFAEEESENGAEWEAGERNGGRSVAQTMRCLAAQQRQWESAGLCE